MQITPSSESLVGPRFVGIAAVFYGVLLFAAVVLGALWGWDVFAMGDSPFFDLCVGVITACCTVVLGVLLYRSVPALRELARELAPQLVEGTRSGELILVAVFSGVGEETFFRGALQPELGIVITSILFGALHIGPDRRFLVWTFWAILAGFLFGFLYEWTGGLLAPTTAHVLHNAATLLLWKRSRRKCA